jgi:dihydrodipicolinate synthase/N-acetylneuraminate lyase
MRVLAHDPYEKCRAGDIERARELHFMLFKLNRAAEAGLLK